MVADVTSRVITINPPPPDPEEEHSFESCFSTWEKSVVLPASSSSCCQNGISPTLSHNSKTDPEGSQSTVSATTALLVPQTKRKFIQPRKSILSRLSPDMIAEVLKYVDQFDLVSLLSTSSLFYQLAVDRLYKRITVNLNAEFATRYGNDHTRYISENGLRCMDSALVLTIPSLQKLLQSLQMNPKLVQKIKVFVFDKCHNDETVDINQIQTKIIDYFGATSREINFLHITFIDFSRGITKLTRFLKNQNIRNRIFKLFVTKTEDLHLPNIPTGLTNLFLMLNETEMMEETVDESGTIVMTKKKDLLDMTTFPFNVLGSLLTLTCNTNNQIGLEILKSIKLFDNDLKLQLRELTVFHCHKQNFGNDHNDYFNDTAIEFEDQKFVSFMGSLDKRLLFSVIDEKVDITKLSHLCLKVDCVDHSHTYCQCFEHFFRDFAAFSEKNRGLPNLNSFELESFPNLEWLRPHQILENILTPVGGFIRTLSGLSRLTIDFSTPGFKMFDSSMGMSTDLLNKLNERLMDAFFLCLFTTKHRKLLENLRTFQLPDFLTSFIYYKPDFYESLLHTCKCWGCDLVLRKLKKMFHPIRDMLDGDHPDIVEDDVSNAHIAGESAYYLIGYILGKLQADREVCVPIKERTVNFSNYPIYKGQPHTLHNGFHITNPETGEVSDKCNCNLETDPSGRSKSNIDALVTTYIVHQLEPIIHYLSIIFFKLDSLMIHGIYYEYSCEHRRLMPIFDDLHYPPEILKEVEGQVGTPDLPFGYFKKSVYP